MLQTLVRDFSYIHSGISLFGNTLFVLGSVLFFKTFEAYYTLAVWCFVVGSSGMLIGAAGSFAKAIYEGRERRVKSQAGRSR